AGGRQLPWDDEDAPLRDGMGPFNRQREACALCSLTVLNWLPHAVEETGGLATFLASAHGRATSCARPRIRLRRADRRRVRRAPELLPQIIWTVLGCGYRTLVRRGSRRRHARASRPHWN